MKLVQGRPPIYDEIVRTLGRPPADAVFTWGDTLFVAKPPIGMTQPLEPALMEHERTHSRQQAIVGGPAEWWRIFLEDPAFRLQQEVAAYRNQYRFAMASGLGRQARRQLLRELANDLASPMYGRIIGRVGALLAIAA